MESLRNGYDLLMAHLRQFVQDNLVVDEQTHSFHDVLAFWKALGQDDETAHGLAVWNLRWENGALRVSASASGVGDDLGNGVVSLMIAVFRFHKFTYSRWMAIALAARSLVGAMTLGLSHLVSSVRASPHTSDYYIGGFEKLDVSALRHSVVAAFGRQRA